ncbi:MAG TPA: UDP-N-acetylmuramoylalanyl-D-glutamyl-2,6-diaminopimelate--D-alanyl-D-alanine ligase [Alphaproteobacteria bacterium]|nr:UDP-N-acetylmuramoylalanyl-D-glutamyl-2,6-diaminopimelate--D-alanyl-D-alanine ligase [Alphaproteobacteria bacterium]
MSRTIWTAEEAAAALGVRAEGAWQATDVSIDTRTLAQGDLFVALKGPKHDGHDHVAAAFANGAAAALVERAPAGLPPGAPLLVVGDTLAALEKLGRASRARNAAVRVVAVTGSVGKTGTKEALKLALGGQGPTHASVGSYNNHIGVPLTLARMPADTAFGVFEIGMNHAGEITPLVRMVRPHVAIITTVEAVHVENFPDEGVKGVAAAKAEMFDGLEGGTAVLNRDNAFFDFLAERARAKGVHRVLSFGEHPSCDARLIEMRLEPTWSQVSAMIEGRAVSYRIGAPGRHWVINSLAVLGAVAALGGDVGAGAASLAQLSAPKGRGLRHRVGRNGDSFELIDDSYNASPASMRASFQVLAAATPGTGGRRIAVLGDMLELGPDSPKLHAGLADALVAAKVDQVFTCGQYMARLYDALPAALRGAHAPNSEALVPLIRAAVRPGDVVVVKGSLGSRMGRIVDALLAGAANTNGPGGPQGRAANG